MKNLTNARWGAQSTICGLNPPTVTIYSGCGDAKPKNPITIGPNIPPISGGGGGCMSISCDKDIVH